MRILAFITAVEPTDANLTHLDLPTTAPPLAPARGPPQHDLAFDADPGFDLDQTPAYDPTEPEPVPDFDFDGSNGAGGAAAPTGIELRLTSADPAPASQPRPPSARIQDPTRQRLVPDRSTADLHSPAGIVDTAAQPVAPCGRRQKWRLKFLFLSSLRLKSLFLQLHLAEGTSHGV
jgi:hypothetical protein